MIKAITRYFIFIEVVCLHEIRNKVYNYELHDFFYNDIEFDEFTNELHTTNHRFFSLFHIVLFLKFILKFWMFYLKLCEILHYIYQVSSERISLSFFAWIWVFEFKLAIRNIAKNLAQLSIAA